MKKIFTFILIVLFAKSFLYGQLIINHLNTDITQLSEAGINKAKSDLHIAYSHTSHGSQLTDGMSGLVTFANNGGKGLSLPSDIFNWNYGGTSGALDLHDYAMDGDVGYYPQWYDNTVNYLNDAENSDVNVVMWSWCGQVGDKYADGTLYSEYLEPMALLESAYPNVKFVYMTGHLDHAYDANNKAANDSIRRHCVREGKILYDFADIESYDPDGTFFQYADDDCSYYSSGSSSIPLGNWAAEWRALHTENFDWYACGAAHTDSLNANQKAYSAWAMFVAIAGTPALTTPTVTTQAVSGISTTTAIGNGTITNLGVPNPTAYGICWNTSGTPTASGSNVNKGAASATGAFTASITSLLANTTYYVRAYATNTDGTSYGAQVSFTTSMPTIAFNSTGSSGLESVSSANLQVDLSAMSGLTVTVDYTVTGTATGIGTDYTLADGTLTIPAGNASGIITIADIVDDLLVEGDETVIVTLSNPVNANLGTNAVHTYTITDNDNVTNVSDISNSNISVYPNPVADNIQFNTISSDVSHIIINDLMGQTVLELEYKGEENINVSHLIPGIYLLNLVNNKGEKRTIKILKE